MGDNERLCAIGPSSAGLEPRTVRSAGERFNYSATGAPLQRCYRLELLVKYLLQNYVFS